MTKAKEKQSDESAAVAELTAERDELKNQLSAAVAQRDALIAMRDETAAAHAEAIVQAVKNAIKETAEAMAQAPQDPPAGATLPEPGARPAGYVDGSTMPIRYIGQRESYMDGAYGTRIQWAKGQTRMVPRAIGALMLKHLDVYQLGEPVLESMAMPREPAIDKSQEEVQDAIDQIANMDKVGLAHFAKTVYNMDVSATQSLADMRTTVTSMVHQFGLA